MPHNPQCNIRPYCEFSESVGMKVPRVQQSVKIWRASVSSQRVPHGNEGFGVPAYLNSGS